MPGIEDRVNTNPNARGRDRGIQAPAAARIAQAGGFSDRQSLIKSYGAPGTGLRHRHRLPSGEQGRQGHSVHRTHGTGDKD